MEQSLENIGSFISAGYTLFMIEGTDYSRTLDLLDKAVPDYNVYTWMPNRLQCQGKCTIDISQPVNDAQLLDMLEAPGQKIMGRDTLPDNTIVLAGLFDVSTQRPDIMMRILHNTLRNQWNRNNRALVIFTPSSKLDSRLEPYVTKLSIKNPTLKELKQLAKQLRRAINKQEVPDNFIFNDNKLEKIYPTLQGMPQYEAENALALAIATLGNAEPEVIIDQLNDVRMAVIRKSDILTYLPPKQRINPRHVGGFQRFLDFMQEKAIAFSPQATKLGIDKPKGVVLLGVPGTGKSMSAKALGSILGLPTVIMNMSAVFGSLVGESEKRVRQALSTVDSLNGCVLLIDEADKALAGATGGGSNDSGTTQRVLGCILSWLQDQKSGTFTVITMNRPASVPPEFLRPGRFDKIFYTDLPTAEERREILLSQLDMRGISKLAIAPNEWRTIDEATTDFTGAELEETVKEAILATFIAQGTKEPSAIMLIEKAKARIPMARFDQERIEEIRDFCRGRAVPVSVNQTDTTVASVFGTQRVISIK